MVGKSKYAQAGGGSSSSILGNSGGDWNKTWGLARSKPGVNNGILDFDELSNIQNDLESGALSGVASTSSVYVPGQQQRTLGIRGRDSAGYMQETMTDTGKDTFLDSLGEVGSAFKKNRAEGIAQQRAAKARGVGLSQTVLGGTVS